MPDIYMGRDTISTSGWESMAENDKELTVYLFDNTHFIYKDKSSNGFNELVELNDDNTDRIVIPYLLYNFDITNIFYGDFMVKYPELSKEISEAFKKSDYASFEKYNLALSDFERKRIFDYIESLSSQK